MEQPLEGDIVYSRTYGKGTVDGIDSIGKEITVRFGNRNSGLIITYDKYGKSIDGSGDTIHIIGDSQDMPDYGIFNRVKQEVVENDFTLGKKDKKVEKDATNPSYYKKGGVECIDAIKASMSEEAFKGFLKGNFMKYVWRYHEKNGVEDLHKAEWYLNRLTKEEENGEK